MRLRNCQRPGINKVAYLLNTVSLQLKIISQTGLTFGGLDAHIHPNLVLSNLGVVSHSQMYNNQLSIRVENWGNSGLAQSWDCMEVPEFKIKCMCAP